MAEDSGKDLEKAERHYLKALSLLEQLHDGIKAGEITPEEVDEHGEKIRPQHERLSAALQELDNAATAHKALSGFHRNAVSGYQLFVKMVEATDTAINQELARTPEANPERTRLLKEKATLESKLNVMPPTDADYRRLKDAVLVVNQQLEATPERNPLREQLESARANVRLDAPKIENEMFNGLTEAYGETRIKKPVSAIGDAQAQQDQLKSYAERFQREFNELVRTRVEKAHEILARGNIQGAARYWEETKREVDQFNKIMQGYEEKGEENPGLLHALIPPADYKKRAELLGILEPDDKVIALEKRLAIQPAPTAPPAPMLAQQPPAVAAPLLPEMMIPAAPGTPTAHDVLTKYQEASRALTMLTDEHFKDLTDEQREKRREEAIGKLEDAVAKHEPMSSYALAYGPEDRNWSTVFQPSARWERAPQPDKISDDILEEIRMAQRILTRDIGLRYIQVVKRLRADPEQHEAMAKEYKKVDEAREYLTSLTDAASTHATSVIRKFARERPISLPSGIPDFADTRKNVDAEFAAAREKVAELAEAAKRRTSEKP